MRVIILLTALVAIMGWIAHEGFLSAFATPAPSEVAANASQPLRELIGGISPRANTELIAPPPAPFTEPQRITQLEAGTLSTADTARQDYWARFRARPAPN